MNGSAHGDDRRVALFTGRTTDGTAFLAIGEQLQRISLQLEALEAESDRTSSYIYPSKESIYLLFGWSNGGEGCAS